MRLIIWLCLFFPYISGADPVSIKYSEKNSVCETYLCEITTLPVQQKSGGYAYSIDSCQAQTCAHPTNQEVRFVHKNIGEYRFEFFKYKKFKYCDCVSYDQNNQEVPCLISYQNNVVTISNQILLDPTKSDPDFLNQFYYRNNLYKKINTSGALLCLE